MGFGRAFEGMDTSSMLESMQTLQQSWLAAATGDRARATSGLDELDKRISDLQAVEQWLSLNLNMLRNTVQGLQVQRASLATLQEMGEAWQKAGLTASNASSAADQPGSPDPSAFWNLLQQQFETIARTTLNAGNPTGSSTATAGSAPSQESNVTNGNSGQEAGETHQTNQAGKRK